MTVDPKYSYENYRLFNFFTLKLVESSETNKRVLQLESQIIESDLHAGDRPVDNRPSIKKVFKRLKLYFDGKFDKVQADIDLSSLELDSPLDVPDVSGTIQDGRVVSSIGIPLPESALKTFKKLKPKSVRAIFFDRDGKIASIADLDGPELPR